MRPSKTVAEILMRLDADSTAVIVDRIAPPLIYAHSLHDESFNELPPLTRKELDFLLDEELIALKTGETFIYRITDKGRCPFNAKVESVWPL